MPKQLGKSFKRTINESKYQSKESIERQNHYSDFLINSRLQGANRHFVLLF